MNSGLGSGMLMRLEWFGTFRSLLGVYCKWEGLGRAKQNDLVSKLIFSRSESSSPRRERKKSSKKKKHRYEVGVRGAIGKI